MGGEELEARVERLEKEHAVMKKEHAETKETLDQNTAMTAEMYLAYTAAKNGVRMIGKAGDAVMWVSDTIERRPKTTVLGLIGAAVSYSFVSTGKLPEWFNAVVKALLA